MRGESYKVDAYERVIGRAFEHVAMSARLKTDTVAQATRPDPEGVDELALARIKREREQAALRFAKDRDLASSRRRWRASTPRRHLRWSARR